MIGKAILEHERNLARIHLRRLKRKIDFINHYLQENEDKSIPIEKANCFISWLDHSDFDYEQIKSEMMG